MDIDRPPQELAEKIVGLKLDNDFLRGEIAKWREENERLRAENAMLRATLQDYANHDRRALEPKP